MFVICLSSGVMWNVLTMAVSVIVACVITYKYKLGPSGYARWVSFDIFFLFWDIIRGVGT